MNIKKKKYFFIAITFLFFGLAFVVLEGVQHKFRFENHSYGQNTAEVIQVDNLKSSIVSKIVDSHDPVEPLKMSLSPELTVNTKADLIQEDTTDEYSESTHSDPILDNVYITAVGPYSDQVNLINSENECIENCINTETVHLLATGEFTDQVNSEALKKYAEMTGLVNSYPPNASELKGATDGLAPPTETGAYTIPD